ncbi:hypothetical protein N7478_013007 [Penicillium angulare]|uniref:uncharacterized protein n=1 Tax=Penicillium angulare TaxID=116970 RepID=UPI00253FF2F6|nr:uncharacterized protein N7478_013007 [Penicillium angulare]KAJ5256903.1 hypothetical protein N7478_013007 [Penicillium angulare]
MSFPNPNHKNTINENIAASNVADLCSSSCLGDEYREEQSGRKSSPVGLKVRFEGTRGRPGTVSGWDDHSNGSPGYWRSERDRARGAERWGVIIAKLASVAGHGVER